MEWPGGMVLKLHMHVPQHVMRQGPTARHEARVPQHVMGRGPTARHEARVPQHVMRQGSHSTS